MHSILRNFIDELKEETEENQNLVFAIELQQPLH